MHKKNEFKIKDFPALVTIAIIYLIQCFNRMWSNEIIDDDFLYRFQFRINSYDICSMQSISNH